MVRNAPPRGSQRRRAQLGVGDWVSCSGDGRRDGRRRCSVGRRRRVQALQERGAGSSGRAAADATGWVAHLLDAVHVSRTHEAADACNHSKGTRYTVEAGPQARVQGCSGGQGRDFGGRVRSWVEARVGGQGRGGGGAGLWLVVGAAAYVSPSPRHQLSFGQQNNCPTCCSGCTPIGISRRSSQRRGRRDREAIFKAWFRSAPTRRLAASVSWAGADDSLARQRWPRSRAAGGADDSLGRQRCSRSDRPRAGAGRPRLG